MLMDRNHITFSDAVACISQYVSHFFPASSTFVQCGRGNVSVINMSLIAQERHGEKYLYNGINITVLRSTGHESREPMITPVKPLQTL